MGNSFTTNDKINAREAFTAWQGGIDETVDSYILRQRKNELRQLVKTVIANELSDYDKTIVKLRWYENMTLEGYKEFIDLADYYTPNRKEAMLMTGAKTPEDAAKILSGFFEKAVVKLDGDGCIGIDNGNMFVVPSIKEYKLKDSTGAGDAFLCGFIYGIYHGYSHRDAILLGNITGGRCITEVGCLSAYTDEKTLLETFEKYR